MNITHLPVAGISTTAQKSESVLLKSRVLPHMDFSWVVGGAKTAFTLQLEGRHFEPNIDMTITDATDADLAAFFDTTGELYIALGRAPAVGDIFQVGGTGDVTDNALATAKGGALADGDLFMVSDIGTEACLYVPNEGFVALHTAVTQATAVPSVNVQKAPRVRVVTSGSWTASTMLRSCVTY